RCAIPYDHPDTRGECGACQKQPPAFARTVALYRYAPPVDHFIRALKFHQQLGLARLLGEQLAQRLVTETARPDVIMPVPLHSARLRERGYNQALEIARPVARTLNIPLDFRSLLRVRATAPQTGMTVAARRKNLRGAFALRDDPGGVVAAMDFDAVRNRRVALVDDVMTTGSTVQAAAQCLLAAGAEKIDIWVVARA
ncbi:MAG TPA: ComF family protein, partial [Acidiferrobacterales bacterium]|nr:ComF family protein [Acidiferrobacterales bacterium]